MVFSTSAFCHDGGLKFDLDLIWYIAKIDFFRQVFEEEQKQKDQEHISVKEKAKMIARQQQQIIEREENQRLEGKVSQIQILYRLLHLDQVCLALIGMTGIHVCAIQPGAEAVGTPQDI